MRRICGTIYTEVEISVDELVECLGEDEINEIVQEHGPKYDLRDVLTYIESHIWNAAEWVELQRSLEAAHVIGNARQRAA